MYKYFILYNYCYLTQNHCCFDWTGAVLYRFFAIKKEIVFKYVWKQKYCYVV